MSLDNTSHPGRAGLDEVIEEHHADVLHRGMSAVGTFRSLATLDHYSRFRETNRHL